MRIVIVTDAWHPQVNGVVRTLQSTRAELEARGHDVTFVSPNLFASLPCPTYPEIRLARASRRTVRTLIEAAEPDAIHIATEGPLGLAARSWCLGTGFPFTTAYHTQFSQYIAARTGMPAAWFWQYIRWFHRPAHSILVATPTLARDLGSRGLPQTRLWTRGVDLSCFRPDVPPHPRLSRLPRPLQLYVGRVAVEKNLDAFLRTETPGSKVVVGEGPALARLKKRFPRVSFVGALRGAELASAYTAADVFVFPSRTDTFGLVIIEALACGVPVAAYPTAGPADILTDEVGAMDQCLATATLTALKKKRELCAAHGKSFSWSASAFQFESALATMEPSRLLAQGL